VTFGKAIGPIFLVLTLGSGILPSVPGREARKLSIRAVTKCLTEMLHRLTQVPIYSTLVSVRLISLKSHAPSCGIVVGNHRAWPTWRQHLRRGRGIHGPFRTSFSTFENEEKCFGDSVVFVHKSHRAPDRNRIFMITDNRPR